MASEQSVTAAARRRTGGSPSATLVPGTVLRQYCIGKVLRLGGLGITYRARDTRRECDVAIKEYLPVDLAGRRSDTRVAPQTPGHSDAFLRGRRLFGDQALRMTGLAATPGLIPVTDSFEANGTAYMVMAWVPHDTLAARLARDGQLSPQAVLRLLPPLLDGLDHLHGAGLLHLDIKPATVAFDAEGAPALFDPGAVRAAIADHTASAVAISAAPYLAPEQFVGGKTGPWTDIYGLAATLHHGITGTALPPARERLGGLVPPVPRDIAKGYPSRVLSGIAAGLAIQPAQRPRSIAAWQPMLADHGGLPSGTDVSSEPRAVPVFAAAAHARSVPRARDGDALIAVPRRTGRWRRRLALACGTIVVASVAAGLAQVDGVLPAAVERQMSALWAAAGFARAESDLGHLPPTAMEAGSRRQAELADSAPFPTPADAQAPVKTAAATIPRQDVDRAAEAEARRRLDAQEAEATARRRERHAAEERARLEAAAREKAEARTRAEEEARRIAEAEARKTTAPASKPEAQARHDAEAAETALKLAEPVRKQVQEALSDLGLGVVSASGTFGPRTRAMIAAWQMKQGVPATGFLTAAQLAALLKQAPRATSNGPSVADRRDAAANEAAMHLSDHDRRRVQMALTALGHDTGGVDGKIMTRTRQMITAWQKSHGDAGTGYLTATQLVLLWLEAHPALERYERELARSRQKPPARDASSAPEQR